MSGPARHEVCAVAIADGFRGDGEIVASPMGLVPTVGARLARATFAPDLLLSDGKASLIAGIAPVGGPASDLLVEGWMPYRAVFDQVWSGRRHVVMGASQIDQFGNQNIACIGDPSRPRAQLLGMRGAPGNTVNHTTSYWVSRHSLRSFVAAVDVVCGIGYDRAATLSARTRRFHEIRQVVSNLGVFDFAGPDHRMRLVSVHPGVEVDEVVAKTGFPLTLDDPTQTTRLPTDEELAFIRQSIDPENLAAKELT